jgi:hypothetical protein
MGNRHHRSQLLRVVREIWSRRSLVPFTAILFGAVVSIQAQSLQNSPPAQQPKPVADNYVGSLACAVCHKDIYRKYLQTGMGRSISQVSPEWLKIQRPSDSVDDKKNSVQFEVYAREGKLYQSEFQSGSGGHEAFRDTHELDWIIGAGENGFGGLVERSDYIFQAPLSFYSKTGRWDLSPGYEFGNYGFNRPILPACIACHSGRPNAISDGNGRFSDPPFSELAIGCENCHGPGLSHVIAAKVGADTYPGHDTSIVNPALLAPALADNICMSCHQTGDVRILKPGKDYRDFRPGSPLDDTMSILLVPPRRESPPQADLLEHYYSMTLSKCYRASGERLSCISCHDPHVEPTRAEAPEYFQKKCLTCHTEKSCTLPLQLREHQQPPDDCAGCHMKKRDVQEISHSSITNHRILGRPDEAFPDIAFQQTTTALPDLIHLDPAPVRKGVPPPALTLLQAYGELAEKHPEYMTRYLAVLADLERTAPENPLVQAAIGNRELHAGRYQEAAAHLQRAVDAGTPKTILYTDLSDALVKLGRNVEAVAVLRKASELDPFNATLRKTLIVQLIQLKDYANAKTEMEDYVKRFPEDSFMRQMLARAQATGRPQ